MRTMTMLALMALVALIAMPAMAKDVEKTSYRTGSPSTMIDRDLDEGFEGSFPPEGWTVNSPSGHTADENWVQGPLDGESVYEGAYIAMVNYDADLIDQDCQLSFDHAIIEGEDHLNFAVAASSHWMITEGNYTMKVLVDGAEVFNLADNYGDTNWVYEIHDIDLTSYIGQTVTLTFQYVGNDGAALYLDRVGVNAGYDVPPPPEAPENDICDGAIALTAGDFSFAGDATEANGTYDTAGSEGCTGYSAAGNDVVYSVTMNPGDELMVTYNTVADGSLYLISDCEDSAGSCLIGADDTLSGADEVITFANATDAVMDLYLILDCYGTGNGGAYTLVGSLTTTVAVETASWTSVKGMFQ